MKTLTFTKKEMTSPLAVSKQDVAQYTKDGNASILMNGILTHIISARDLIRYDSDEISNCLQSIISVMLSGELASYELAFDGQHVVRMEDFGDKYVFTMHKIVPEYENVE